MRLLLNLAEIWRVAHRVHLVVSNQPMIANSKMLLFSIGIFPAKLQVHLHAVIVDKADAVDEANDELVTGGVDLHRCDVIWRLLPCDNFPLIHVPYSDGFVKTAGCNVVFRGGLDEERRAKNIRVLQYLNRFVEVDVPDDDEAVSAD